MKSEHNPKTFSELKVGEKFKLLPYRVKCDEENNPPDVVAKNEMIATITFREDNRIYTKIESIEDKWGNYFVAVRNDGHLIDSDAISANEYVETDFSDEEASESFLRINCGDCGRYMTHITMPRDGWKCIFCAVEKQTQSHNDDEIIPESPCVMGTNGFCKTHSVCELMREQLSENYKILEHVKKVGIING